MAVLACVFPNSNIKRCAKPNHLDMDRVRVKVGKMVNETWR